MKFLIGFLVGLSLALTQIDLPKVYESVVETEEFKPFCFTLDKLSKYGLYVFDKDVQLQFIKFGEHKNILHGLYTSMYKEDYIIIPCPKFIGIDVETEKHLKGVGLLEKLNKSMKM